MTGGGGRPRFTVIYDGDCKVCRRSVEWLRERDREGLLEPVPYQDPGIPERFPQLPADRFQEALQLIGPGGERREGARAVARILTLLPRWRPLGFLMDVPGIRGVAGWVYRRVAASRRRFGCRDHCGPEPGA